MASSISSERWPKSVAWTRTAPPRSNRKPMGSTASCGVRNGVAVIVPMRRLSRGTRGSHSGVSAPFREIRQFQVPSVQATGIPWRTANVVALRQWSPCSWETSTAAMSDGVRPASAIRFSSARQESPASTSRVVGPPETSAAFPELPEPRTRRLISMTKSGSEEGGGHRGREGASVAPARGLGQRPNPKILGVSARPTTMGCGATAWNAGFSRHRWPEASATASRQLSVMALPAWNADLWSARAALCAAHVATPRVLTAPRALS